MLSIQFRVGIRPAYSAMKSAWVHAVLSSVLSSELVNSVKAWMLRISISV